MKDNCSLVNGVQNSELYETFEMPSYPERANVEPGKRCMIEVRWGYNVYSPEIDCMVEGERFWVEVIHGRAGRYVGRVDNKLRHAAQHGLKFNDSVRFDDRHVLAIKTVERRFV
jgi:hypothetical protein